MFGYGQESARHPSCGHVRVGAAEAVESGLEALQLPLGDVALLAPLSEVRVEAVEHVVESVLAASGGLCPGIGQQLDGCPRQPQDGQDECARSHAEAAAVGHSTTRLAAGHDDGEGDVDVDVDVDDDDVQGRKEGQRSLDAIVVLWCSSTS